MKNEDVDIDRIPNTFWIQKSENDFDFDEKLPSNEWWYDEVETGNIFICLCGTSPCDVGDIFDWKLFANMGEKGSFF